VTDYGISKNHNQKTEILATLDYKNFGSSVMIFWYPKIGWSITRI